MAANPFARAIEDRDLGKRFLLFFYLIIQMLLIGVALWPTCWLLLRFAPRVSFPTQWVLLILVAILLFNYAYVLALLVLRLVIPFSKPGFYPNRLGGRPPKEILILMLNVLLVKVRYDTPWASMFSSVLVQLPPLGVLFRRFFGPHTTSASMGDTCLFLDPHLVEAGKNVQFGFLAMILCHLYDNRGLTIRKVKIGDHAVIGAESLILPGVEVGHHAVIGARSMVLPDTIIPPYEYWGGSPAEKIKDLAVG